jgi:hypothetical protein
MYSDAVMQKILEKEGCQWIGPDQDPLIHSPIKYCGCKVIPGKAYCAEHYPRVYMVGSAITKGRSASNRGKKATDTMTVDEVMDLMNEVIKELEDEGVL